jgi:hypothetical protein
MGELPPNVTTFSSGVEERAVERLTLTPSREGCVEERPLFGAEVLSDEDVRERSTSSRSSPVRRSASRL